MKFYSKVLACALLLVSCTSSAHQSFEIGEHSILGLGAKSCESYLSSKNDKGHEYLYRSWISGYVSGLGFVLTKNNAFLKRLDIHEFYQDVEAICQVELERNVYDVVNQLVLLKIAPKEKNQ